MEGDDGSHLRLEPEEAAFELVTIGHGGLRAGDGRWVERREVDIEAMAPEPARLVDRGADEQSVEPGVEAIRVPERR
jgi:hypothetical protein